MSLRDTTHPDYHFTGLVVPSAELSIMAAEEGALPERNSLDGQDCAVVVLHPSPTSTRDYQTSQPLHGAMVKSGIPSLMGRGTRRSSDQPPLAEQCSNGTAGIEGLPEGLSGFLMPSD